MDKSGLTNSEIVDFRREFDAIDVDGNGKLTLEEIEGMIKNKQGGKAPSREEVSATFESFDLNSDGFITFDEFVQVVSASQILNGLEMFFGARDDQLGVTPATRALMDKSGLTYSEIVDFRREFDSIDVDGNGKLTLQEIEGMIKNKQGGKAPSREEVSATFESFDLNSDGFITFDEFVQVLSASQILNGLEMFFGARGQPE